MNSDHKEHHTIYRVVVNHEGQYSIWPAERENPVGWKERSEERVKGGVPGLHQRSVE
jgi:MbtH protein